MACLFPITIKNPKFRIFAGEFSHIPVPCGKCPTCLNTRISAWSFRLMWHEKISSSSYFITLTYGTNDKPGFIESPNGLNTLRKKDVQDFMKRLRFSYSYRALNPLTGRMKRYYDKVPAIKYFAVGEYGSKRQRPHYHLIIFNADLRAIEAAWPHGFVHSGTVTGASIAYTLKYMHKGKTVPRFELDDRQPEFQLVSKGLGLNYVTPEIIAYHRADLSRTYCTIEGGVKIAMPRYFRQLIFTDSQRAAQARLAQDMQRKKLDKRMRDFDVATNGRDNFYRCDAEARRAALVSFRDRQRQRCIQF